MESSGFLVRNVTIIEILYMIFVYYYESYRNSYTIEWEGIVKESISMDERFSLSSSSFW